MTTYTLPNHAEPWLLTTDHPASHYSIPVLIGPDGQAYGPRDNTKGPVATSIFGPQPWPAAYIVAGPPRSRGNEEPSLTGETRRMADLYLSQWPEGPQLLPRLCMSREAVDEREAFRVAHNTYWHESAEGWAAGAPSCLPCAT